MSKRSLSDVLAADMSDLTPRKKECKRPVKWTADSPTWRQPKSLCDEGEAVVPLVGKPLNATTLFLFMQSVVTVEVIRINRPINMGGRWGDKDILVMVKESSWLSDPNDN